MLAREKVTKTGGDCPALAKQNFNGRLKTNSNVKVEREGGKKRKGRARVRRYTGQGNVCTLDETQLIKFDIPKCPNQKCLFQELFCILHAFPLTSETYLRLWRNFSLRPLRTRQQKAKAHAILEHLHDVRSFRESLAEQLVEWNRKVDKASKNIPRVGFVIQCLQQSRLQPPPFLQIQAHRLNQKMPDPQREVRILERVRAAWLPLYLQDPPQWAHLTEQIVKAHNLPESLEILMEEDNPQIPQSRCQ